MKYEQFFQRKLFQEMIDNQQKLLKSPSVSMFKIKHYEIKRFIWKNHPAIMVLDSGDNSEELLICSSSQCVKDHDKDCLKCESCKRLVATLSLYDVTSVSYSNY